MNTIFFFLHISFYIKSEPLPSQKSQLVLQYYLCLYLYIITKSFLLKISYQLCNLLINYIYIYIYLFSYYYIFSYQ